MKKNLKLLKKILDKKKWCQFWILMILMFGATLLECIGISFVLPVISVLLRPEFLTEHPLGIWLMRLFRSRDEGQFVTAALCMIGICYLLKNVYLLMVNACKNRFILRCQFEWKERILSGFFYGPYTEALQYSTPELVQAVETDVDGCVILMEKLLRIGGEVMMIALLAVGMLGINPVITLGVSALCGLLMLVFLRVIKPYSEQKSRQYAGARKDFSKWLYQSMGNLKEIKAEHKEYYFIRNYSGYAQTASRIDTRVRFIQTIPRALFELCLVGCMLLVVFFLMGNTKESVQVVTQMSVFGVIIVRLMPSVLTLNQLLGSCFWHVPMLERTAERMTRYHGRQQETKDAGTLKLQKQLNLQQISFRYPGTEEMIFHQASMSIRAGEITGISGESGAGKTTLVDLMIGLLPVSDGDILADGCSLLKDKDRMTAWQNGIAYIPQNVCLLNATIRDNVLFGSEDRGDTAIWEVLKLAAADEFVGKLPLGLNTMVGENGSRLSGGQLQRLALARALYRNAHFLILDETTSALDAETEQTILDALKKLCGLCTIVLISHRSQMLDGCHRRYRIEGGKIIEVS